MTPKQQLLDRIEELEHTYEHEWNWTDDEKQCECECGIRTEHNVALLWTSYGHGADFECTRCQYDSESHRPDHGNRWKPVTEKMRKEYFKQ